MDYFEILPAKSGELPAGVCPRRLKALRSEYFFRGGRPDLLKNTHI
jgi:hypothetical protein